MTTEEEIISMKVYQESVLLMREILNSESYSLALLMDSNVEGWREIEDKTLLELGFTGLFYVGNARETGEAFTYPFEKCILSDILLCIDCSAVYSGYILHSNFSMNYYIVSNTKSMDSITLTQGFAGAKDEAVKGVSIVLKIDMLGDTERKAIHGLEEHIIEVTSSNTSFGDLDNVYDLTKFVNLKYITCNLHLPYISDVCLLDTNVVVMKKWKKEGYCLRFILTGFTLHSGNTELYCCILLSYFGELLLGSRFDTTLMLGDFSTNTALCCYKLLNCSLSIENFNSSIRNHIIDYCTTEEIEEVKRTVLYVVHYIDGCN